MTNPKIVRTNEIIAYLEDKRTMFDYLRPIYNLRHCINDEEALAGVAEHYNTSLDGVRKMVDNKRIANKKSHIQQSRMMFYKMGK